MADSPAKQHRTVSRVTTILEQVADRPAGMQLAELAAALDAPKTSLYGLVKGLVAEGYLVENNARYTLGPALDNLLTTNRPALADLIKPVLAELRDKFGETTMLGTRVGDSLVYVASAESAQLIRYSAPLRHRRPLYPPSAGKILLAAMPSARQTTRLRATLADDEAVQRALVDLNNVRSAGVAFNRGETLPDVSAVARPLLVNGRISAAIAVAGPTARIGARLETIAEDLKSYVQAAQRAI